jgi:hypothetical protein
MESTICNKSSNYGRKQRGKYTFSIVILYFVDKQINFQFQLFILLLVSMFVNYKCYITIVGDVERLCMFET